MPAVKKILETSMKTKLNAKFKSKFGTDPKSINSKSQTDFIDMIAEVMADTMHDYILNFSIVIMPTDLTGVTYVTPAGAPAPVLSAKPIVLKLTDKI